MANATDHSPQGPDKRQWFVRMSNGSTFGPINTKGLVFWAEEGRIMPDDEISEDRTDWVPAQELPELGMDTLIERPDGSFAGPFHPHAIEPLAQEGKIPPNARTFHRDELPAMLAARQMALFADPPAAPAPAPAEEPAKPAKPRDPERAALKRENQRLAERVAELEAALDEIRVQANDAKAEVEREADELRAALANAVAERDAARAATHEEASQNAGQSAGLDAAEPDTAALDALHDALRVAEQERDAARQAAAAQEQAGPLLRSELEAVRNELEKVRASFSEQEQAAQSVGAEQAQAIGALRSELEAVQAQFEQARASLAEREHALHVAEAAVAGQGDVAAQVESLRSSLAAETSRRLAAEEREARANESLDELRTDRENEVARADRLTSELERARADYMELLSFSNTRDAEYEARLEASAAKPSAAVEAVPDEPAVGEPRRIQAMESQIVALRGELEDARQRLQQADVAATQAARPQEPEIARIEAFAEAALTTLQTVLEQERTQNEQARAASATRQESLHAEIERLQRALRVAPGEDTRAQQLEKRNDRLIAKLKQELESARRQHQAELHQAAEHQRELEQRMASLEKRESSARDQLSRVEQRAADYDSLASQLRRRETALLTAEREFETARQQWQAVEAALMRRIEELESGASRLLAEQEGQSGGPARPATFQAKPWMKLQR